MFLTRKLAVEDASPLRNRIMVAPENNFASAAKLADVDWKVSFSTVVGGILRLISSNPKQDANLLMTPRRTSRQRGPATRADRSVLRQYYLEGNDQLLYDVVRNFLSACLTVFWTDAKPNSYIRKTVGIQALFDVMRDLVREGLVKEDLTEAFFAKRMAPVANIDFADARFVNPSGSGRGFIRRLIQANLNLPFTGELSPEDKARFVD